MTTNPYRASVKKASDNLLAEQVKQEINWRTIELIGRELVIIAGEAQKEPVKQKQNYILSKFREG